MFIFVEGPDGAGKTTLIEKLRHKIGDGTCIVKHFGVPEDPTTQVGMYMREMIDAWHRVVIFDRCWYSDMVYGPVMRGESGVSELDCKLLEEFARNNGGGFIIYVSSRVETLWARCQQRGEDYIKDINQLRSIRVGYEQVIEQAGLPIHRIIT